MTGRRLDGGGDREDVVSSALADVTVGDDGQGGKQEEHDQHDGLQSIILNSYCVRSTQRSLICPRSAPYRRNKSSAVLGPVAELHPRPVHRQIPAGIPVDLRVEIEQERSPP